MKRFNDVIVKCFQRCFEIIISGLPDFWLMVYMAYTTLNCCYRCVCCKQLNIHRVIKIYLTFRRIITYTPLNIL